MVVVVVVEGDSRSFTDRFGVWSWLTFLKTYASIDFESGHLSILAWNLMLLIWSVRLSLSMVCIRVLQCYRMWRDCWQQPPVRPRPPHTRLARPDLGWDSGGDFLLYPAPHITLLRLVVETGILASIIRANLWTYCSKHKNDPFAISISNKYSNWYCI